MRWFARRSGQLAARRNGPSSAREVQDRGSGSVLAIAVTAGFTAVVLLGVPLYSVFVVRGRIAASADAAALAAADSLAGFVSGDPCAIAAEVAGATGAVLGSCRVDGMVVTVVVKAAAERAILGIPVSQTATAGPPP